MNGANKVILVATLGKDPETRVSQTGTHMTNFSCATSEKWKDKQTGQQQEKTEWHNIVIFNRLAEVAAQYLKKGSKVYLEGKLQTRKWQDQSGNDRYTTEILVGQMQMLDSKQSSDSNDNRSPQQADPSQPISQEVPQQAPGFDDFDDSILF